MSRIPKRGKNISPFIFLAQNAPVLIRNDSLIFEEHKQKPLVRSLIYNKLRSIIIYMSSHQRVFSENL